MKFNLTDIDYALKYYNIEDYDYKAKCYECVEYLNSTKAFNKKAEQIYNILFSSNFVEINKLWQKQNMIELFGKNFNPFITCVLVLIGGGRNHDKNMSLKGFNLLEKNLYKSRVRETLTKDIYIKRLDGIRISQMLWAAYFINVILIEVGILQFENCENFIKIHIPSGNKLLVENVIESIKKARYDIKKYFNKENPEFRCDSWLLSKQLNAIIDCNTNISKFYNLFNVKDGADATKDILNFVFGLQACNDYNLLEEKTSLQKKLKRALIEKKEINLGLGILKNNI